MPHVILVHYAAVPLWTRLHWCTVSVGDRQSKEELVSTGSTSRHSLVWYQRQKHRTSVFFPCLCFWKSFGYRMHPDNNAALQLNFMMLQVGFPVVLHQHCSVSTICVSFSVILSFRYIIFLFICIGKHPLIFCWYLYFPFSDYFFNQRRKLAAVCHHVHWNPVPSPLAPLHPMLLCVCKSSPVNSNSEQSRVALLISPGSHLLDGADDDEMVPDGMIKASHHHVKVINLSFTNGNL